MENKRVYALLGLAMKAGKIAGGGFLAEKAVRESGAYAVIVAADASANTRKRFTDLCAYRGVPLFVFGTKDGLGAAIGREERSCLAVGDAGFAKALEKEIIGKDRDGGSAIGRAERGRNEKRDQKRRSDDGRFGRKKGRDGYGEQYNG